MNSEEALKAFFEMESESELSSLTCTSTEESESDKEPCEKDFSDQEEEDQTPMQPDYKENISHPTCIQNGVFVEPVGTKREKMESKQRKRHVTIVQSVKSSFVKNALKVLTPRVRSENY